MKLTVGFTPPPHTHLVTKPMVGSGEVMVLGWQAAMFLFAGIMGVVNIMAAVWCRGFIGL